MQAYAQCLVWLAAAILLQPAMVFAGRGGSDKTPPADIDALAVKAGGLALTLRFTAPGDDGWAGTAARYDVFYRIGTDCSDADNPGANPDANPDWIRAARSDVTVPDAGGKIDMFNVRPLQSAQGYCLAIRVGDEVPNWSHWKVAAGATEPYWESSRSWPVAPSQDLAGDLGIVNTASGPVAAWRMDNKTAVFVGDDWVGDDWQETVALDIASSSFGSPPFRVAANPGAGPSIPTVGGVWTNTYTSGSRKNTTLFNRLLLLEAGPGFLNRVTEIASGPRLAGGLDEPFGGGSTITYVRSGGVWNPATTLERIERKDSGVKRTSLTIAERVEGVWIETPVLTHEAADQRYGFFERAELLTKPDGITLAFVAPHCGITVYGEREVADGSWTYWDAGQALSSYRAGFDATTGSVAIAGRPDALAQNTVVLYEKDFALLSGGMPAATCDSVDPQATSPGETVTVATDPDMPYAYTTGVALRDGATFVSVTVAEGNYKSAEQRVLYRCAPDPSWSLLIADRTNSVQTMAEPINASDGSILRGYFWGRFARILSQPSYTTPPDDLVYIATRPNPCL